MSAREPEPHNIAASQKVERAMPRVGVIYNPRSHRNKGQDLASDPAPHVYVAQPGERDQLPGALKELNEWGMDLLVINGGDGTVRDVLSAGHAVFGDSWPAVAVLPKGKTNALTVDLDGPQGWSLQGAIDAFRNGRRIVRQPLAIHPDGQPERTMLGFILGAGAYTLGIRAGQDAHRMGAFNSLAVAVTTVWGVASAFVGSRNNPWRRGVAMEILLGDDAVPLAHSGKGDPARRQLLLASTLHRFPAGIKPFGNLRQGLKLAVMDPVDRRTSALIPAVVMGWQSGDMAQRGFHQLEASRFALTLDDEFILDGEAYPPGSYIVAPGPAIEFVAP